MTKFFTIYDKIKKWLVLATFAVLYLIIFVPLKFENLTISSLAETTYYDVICFNDPDCIWYSEYDRYCGLISLCFLIMFFILTILTLIFVFKNKNFPNYIPIAALLILFFICFNQYIPETNDRAAQINRITLFKSLIYRIPTFILFTAWLTLDLLSKYRHRILSKSNQ